jgi:hypothetical protein
MVLSVPTEREILEQLIATWFELLTHWRVGSVALPALLTCSFSTEPTPWHGAKSRIPVSKCSVQARTHALAFLLALLAAGKPLTTWLFVVNVTVPSLLFTSFFEWLCSYVLAAHARVTNGTACSLPVLAIRHGCGLPPACLHPE